MNFACYRSLKKKKRIKFGTELISVRNVALRTWFEFLPSSGLVWVLVLEGRDRIGGQLPVQAACQAEGEPTNNYEEENKMGESEERQELGSMATCGLP